MHISRFFLFVVTAAAPVFAADQPLTGFPFQSETLRYNIKLATGVNLGEASMSASKVEGGGWRFDTTFNASMPAFPFVDSYRSTVASFDLCSVELMRQLQHGSKKVTEKTTFDQKANVAQRQTLSPAGGGKSELQLPTCGRDALAYVYWSRREMGQGRVPASSRVFFGNGYEVRNEYTGAVTVVRGDKSETTDHVNVSIKGPKSDVTLEIFYARDAARTPLQVKIPVSLGKITLDLVR